MSENPATGHDTSHASPGPATTSTAPENPFSRQDLEEFDSDDVLAGSAIGKMLAVIFLYTIFAMSIAAWWTFGRS